GEARSGLPGALAAFSSAPSCRVRKQPVRPVRSMCRRTAVHSAPLEGPPVLASVPAATLLGVTGHPVDVEVYVGNGLPSLSIVGLPDASCREARDRVRAAVLSSDLEWPQRRITV